MTNIRGYIRRFTDDYKGHTSVTGCLRGLIYSSVNRRIYRPTCQTRALAPWTNIFVSDVSLMNVTEYIRWCHVIDEYIVIFIGTDE
jgi:hypothetical protein